MIMLATVNNVCDFKRYLVENKPFTTHFLADTLAFILVTNKHDLMDILMCSCDNEQRHILVNLMEAEGPKYKDWVDMYTKHASTSTAIEDDVEDDVEALVDSALGDSASVDSAPGDKMFDYEKDEYTWGVSSDDDDGDLVQEIGNALKF